ncbi:MAG TPA: hypothetical protein VFF17_02580 [Thermoanaerobaculia bacterium]|nr:hypothetical protein [Thermoanaerobaculia bacterium]
MAEDTRYPGETPPQIPSYAAAPGGAAPPPAVAAEGYRPPVAPIIVEKKSPGLAGILSAIFPGLGQLYLGLYQRAFKIAAAFAGCIWLVTSTDRFHGSIAPLFGLGIAFTWFFGIIDAVRQAKAINAGSVDAGGLAVSERVPRVKRESTASLTWGVILVGIGTLWLIDRYVDLDWFWAAVEDWLAPVAFILLGVVLIATYVIKKRKHNESEVWPPRNPA